AYWFDERFTMIEEADLFTRIAYTWKLIYVDRFLGKALMHSDSWFFCNPLSLPQERKIMIDTYNQIFDNFQANYANEIKHLNATIAADIAKVNLAQGNNRLARAKLAPYVGSGYKFLLFYLICFFPAKIYEIIQKWRGQWWI
ncbi:MAG: hypothetical protein ACYDH2_14360, partial [Anaerolineaceae bacterium]